MKFEGGDKIVYLGEDPNECGNLTIGKIYEFKADDISSYIEDDFGDCWYVSPGARNLQCFDKVVKNDTEISIAPIDTSEDEKDMINSPDHYNSGKFETIDVIKHVVQGYDNPFIGHCIGTTVKYLDRAPYKHENPVECLEKAVWYLKKAIETVKEEDKE